MRWLRVLAGVAAVALLLVLLSGPARTPGDAEVQRRLQAHPEMAPYNRFNATIARIAPESLPKLAADQPAVYGNLPASSSLYRVEFSGPESRALVIYDAGGDRVLRVFNLFEGRLE